jgi:nucleotide-binding universal stress UspA family protein
MRVVVGYDGSGGSEIAAALLAGVVWPSGSEFHFVHAVATRAASPPRHVLSSAAGRVPRQTAIEDAEIALESAEKWLDAIPGAEMIVAYGRAAKVLSNEARKIGADLVIVGSGGRGPYSSLLLGSVSADVVDNAPCPVLVARRSTVEHVLVATDGSETAELGVRAVSEWPMFEPASIKVISVGDVLHGHGESHETDFDHVAVAAATARGLRTAGRHARATIRVGDPAQQILAVAKRSRADLVVLGTRGHTGLARAILGSTAREVLLSTQASVLVAR